MMLESNWHEARSAIHKTYQATLADVVRDGRYYSEWSRKNHNSFVLSSCQGWKISQWILVRLKTN